MPRTWHWSYDAHSIESPSRFSWVQSFHVEAGGGILCKVVTEVCLCSSLTCIPWPLRLPGSLLMWHCWHPAAGLQESVDKKHCSHPPSLPHFLPTARITIRAQIKLLAVAAQEPLFGMISALLAAVVLGAAAAWFSTGIRVAPLPLQSLPLLDS